MEPLRTVAISPQYTLTVCCSGEEKDRYVSRIEKNEDKGPRTIYESYPFPSEAEAEQAGRDYLLHLKKG